MGHPVGPLITVTPFRSSRPGSRVLFRDPRPWPRLAECGHDESVRRVTAHVSDTWVRETGRDLLALGSATFYVMVIGRALVGPFWALLIPLLVIGAGLVVAAWQRWDVDLSVVRGLVIAVLLTQHYEDAVFGVFAAGAFVLMVVAAIHLGRSRRSVERGIAAGLAAGAIGLAMASLID